MKKTLRLILGDQLNLQHSWFKKEDNNYTYVLMETMEEASYVSHHIQKVIAFFLSMRNFNDSLNEKGFQTIYLKLDNSSNLQSFSDNITHLVESQNFERFEYQLPDEYRLDIVLKELTNQLSIECAACDTEHFFTSRLELKDFFEKKKSKQWLMESFYRAMRKKHQILIENDDKPVGGKWNYDASNRKKLPKDLTVISPKLYAKDVSEIHALILKMGIKTIGNVDEKSFIWPTNREESTDLLEFFIVNCLPYFGDFQDAMAKNLWSIYHSRLSFALNSKMLSPKEVIDEILSYWEHNRTEIDVSQVEGFIRQILGWREYMRGIYWAKMPEYEKENKLSHNNKLPEFYWTGKTKMNCLQDTIQQSLDYAYAHHIQRLMVTGNFALLAGINPAEVDQWYLGIYIDAIQWVELPNTRGMSQYADGGLIATKPYVSSANYINKMSNYCQKCHYNSSEKIGDKACPFNSLYWNFIDRHIDLWKKNQRMGIIVANWQKQDPDQKTAVLNQAAKYLANLDQL